MPNEQDGGSQNPPDPKYVTEEQIGNVVNAAVTNHIKRLTEKTLPQMFEAALKPIQDKLAAPPPTKEDETETKGKAKGVDPQIAALQQQLEDFKKQAQDAEAKRLAAEKKQREDRAFSDLKSALTPHVRGDMLDILANHLFKIQGAVEVDEETGTALFKSTRTNLGVEEEVRLPLKDGVDAFLKSDTAKPFLPSPGVSNTPPVKKNAFTPPVSKEPADLSKATPEQKLKAALDLEAKIKQQLAAAGKSL